MAKLSVEEAKRRYMHTNHHNESLFDIFGYISYLFEHKNPNNLMAEEILVWIQSRYPILKKQFDDKGSEPCVERDAIVKRSGISSFDAFEAYVDNFFDNKELCKETLVNVRAAHGQVDQEMTQMVKDRLGPSLTYRFNA